MMKPLIFLSFAISQALPNRPWASRLFFDSEDDAVCRTPQYCDEPKLPFKRKQHVSPRIQWDDAGGYCGAMSIQNVALGKGVWISQQQVRDHTKPGGGHDNEILATNIDEALRRLRLTYESFDYKSEPVPQADAYRSWLKRQLAQGHGVAWMIMLAGGDYPVYPGLPYGFYSHVEPVIAIYSKNPLNDTEWYDDDVLAHGTDASTRTYYRRFDSLPADVNAKNQSECKFLYVGSPCIYVNYGFGWAITGVDDADDLTNGIAVALTVDRADEPDLRAGDKPAELHGTLIIEGLEIGALYDIHRFHNDEAFDYSDSSASWIHAFQANATALTYVDPTVIHSSDVVYYRVRRRT